MTTSDFGDRRPPYWAALAAAGAILMLYVVTLAPTTAFWDTSEYIATAHILGIPHPPGNPFFVVIGKAWSLLLAPLGLSVAVRINLLAATTSAAASGFLYLVAHRVLAGLFDDDRFALVGAAASALLGATAFTVWSQSTVNEKVYTVSILVIAVVTWLAVRWRDRCHETGSERLLLWAVFLMAIGSTNHPMSLLPAPALAVFVLMTDLRVVFRLPFLARAIPLVLLGLSFNFVLPVRAELDPVINEGDPTCVSVMDAAAAVFSGGRVGCPMLADNLKRTQYQTPPVTQRKAPFRAQLAMYAQYFDWQWGRGVDPSEMPGTARLPFALLFGALGILGLWAAWRVDRAVFALLLVLAGTLSVGLVVYLNFRYGYSLNPEIADPAMHEVRERDYFYVGSFLVWGMLAGMGLGWIWHTVAGISSGQRRYARASPVLLVALFPLLFNWSWASRAGDYAARDWAYDLLMSVEPYGILFTNGDNDTFPLWYLQEVEGLRQDVTVIVGQYLFTSWYPKQLQALTTPGRQRPYVATVPGLYDDLGMPSRSITQIEAGTMDQIGSSELSEDLTVPLPGIAVTYPAGIVLDRANLLALLIIRDAIEERPIYFAASGGMLNELGLERWGVRHGLATKLRMRRIEGEQPPELVEGSPEFGGEWWELERSVRLYDEVYQYRGIRDREIWQDRSTLNIPFQYFALALQLADAARIAGGDPDLVQRLQDEALGFQVVAQGGVRGTPGG